MQAVLATTEQAEQLEAESRALLEQAATAPDDATRDAAIEIAVEKAGDAELAAAYAYLQTCLGLLAFFLPIALVAGDGFNLRGSISAYYYSRMGNVFVGALWAMGVFFLSYNYRPIKQSFRIDRLLSNFACFFAIGVAVFPTVSQKTEDAGENFIKAVHLTCAGLLFTLLGVFALLLFTQSDKDPATWTPQTRLRNRVYRTCGVLIFAAILTIGIFAFIKEPDWWHTMFWMETVCVEAFALSWLVKGGFLGILADPPADPV